MKVQKVEGRRLKPCSAHPWFRAHPNIWRELKAGKAVDLPEEESKVIKELYGDSLKEVGSKKLEIKKETEVSDDS